MNMEHKGGRAEMMWAVPWLAGRQHTLDGLGSLPLPGPMLVSLLCLSQDVKNLGWFLRAF